MAFARAELARRVLRTLIAGDVVTVSDAFQLRNWAVSPEDAMLSLEEIACHILEEEEHPKGKAAKTGS